MQIKTLKTHLLLLVVVGMASTLPSVFGAEVSVPAGTSVPGCEETNECWDPAELTIGVGETVVWSNDDTAAHTVTSGSAKMDRMETLTAVCSWQAPHSNRHLTLQVNSHTSAWFIHGW